MIGHAQGNSAMLGHLRGTANGPIPYLKGIGGYFRVGISIRSVSSMKLRKRPFAPSLTSTQREPRKVTQKDTSRGTGTNKKKESECHPRDQTVVA